MADENKLEIEIVLDDGSVRKGFATIRKESKTTEKEVKGLGEQFREEFGKLGKNIGLATIAILGIRTAISFVKQSLTESIGAFIRQENAVNNLNATLNLFNSFSRSASKDIQNFAAEIEKSTKVSDEQALELFNLARAFTRTNDEAKNLVKAGLDAAEGASISLESAVRNLGKTYSGLIGELGESIPEIRNLTAEQLKAGKAVEVVAQKFDGLAKAQLQTTSGQLARLSNTFGTFLERVGEAITQTPIFKNLISGLTVSLQGLSDLIGTQSDRQLKKFTERIGENANSIEVTRTKIKELQADLEKTSFERFASGAGSVKVIEGNIRLLQTRLSQLTEEEKTINAEFDQFLSKLSETARKRNEAVAKGPDKQALDNQRQFNQQLLELQLQNVDAQVKAADFINNERERQVELDALRLEKSLLVEEQFNQRKAELKRQFEQNSLITKQEFNQLEVELEIQKQLQLEEIRRQFSQNQQAEFDQFINGFVEGLSRLEVSIKQVGKTAAQSFVNGIGSSFAAFGRALAQGENAFEAFGKNFLGVLGGIAIQLGQFYISVGIAQLASGVVLGPSPAQAIASGIALTILGGVLQGLGGASVQGGGVGQGGGFVDTTETTTPEIADDELAQQGAQITVNVEGNVLTTSDRALGQELVQVIQEAFDTTGATVIRGS